MLDVIVAGSGPAGSVAALLLARSGARVLIVDRAGGSRGPSASSSAVGAAGLAELAALGLPDGPVDGAGAVRGVRVSGPRYSADFAYDHDARPRIVPHAALTTWLLEAAVRAGARFEGGVSARRPIYEVTATGNIVRGLVLTSRRTRVDTRMPAAMVIAADGAPSMLARSVQLRRASSARRWVFCAPVAGLPDLTDDHEIHVRRGWRLGLAAIRSDLASATLVMSSPPPGDLIARIFERTLANVARLAAHGARPSVVGAVDVRGPLTTAPRSPGVPGLLLAGDAAGCLDPLGGDGLYHAMAGARLAAVEAQQALEDGDVPAAIGRLADARQRAFARMWKRDRWVRAVLDRPATIDALMLGGGIWPGAIQAVARYAAGAAVRAAS